MEPYVTGTAIRQLREAKHLTQAELAEKLAVSAKAISKWETARGLPDISLLEPLAAALGEEAVTLEDLCEPYLMQMGFLTRTPRGRCVTRLAYEHLGMKAPESGAPEDNGQQSLF